MISKRFKNLKKGHKRLLISLGIVIPLITVVLFEKDVVVELVLPLLFITYWILVEVILWIREGYITSEN